MLTPRNVLRTLSSKRMNLTHSAPPVLVQGKHTLVLVRHGESTWNQKNLFTGWYDCPLSEKGHKEAAAAGALIKKEGFTFDLAYTSMLQRAIRTLWYTLEETGLDKQQTVDKHGKEQVLVWRRSYDIPPPECDPESEHCPANDAKYSSNVEASAIRTESLSTTLDRVLPLWEEEIVPEIKAGKNIIIAAHGNSLRALVKHLDSIPEAEISELNIPTGVPLVYELDDNLKPIAHSDAIAPLSGRYLGNQADIRARIEGVKNQTK
eukprot:GSChrysophyteH1.ASY1.ANO1.3048.1 assembled CDS